MFLYLDTGCLLKLYYLEANSGAVISAVADATMIFTELHELELAAALHAKCFRGEASQQQVEAAMRLVQFDVDRGKLVQPAILWHKVLKTAAGLAQNYSAATGCRSLDLLHCALAQATRATRFISSDRRQISAGISMGLPVFAI